MLPLLKRDGKTYRARPAVLVMCVLSGCAGIQPPPEQRNERSFTQQSTKPYEEAYKIIGKQMRTCYRAIGLFGNGYEVQSDLDTTKETGTVELYYIGLDGAPSKAEKSAYSRTVTISATPQGSVITTKGTTPRYVYLTHKSIPGWLEGKVSCDPSAH